MGPLLLVLLYFVAALFLGGVYVVGSSLGGCCDRLSPTSFVNLRLV